MRLELLRHFAWPNVAIDILRARISAQPYQAIGLHRLSALADRELHAPKTLYCIGKHVPLAICMDHSFLDEKFSMMKRYKWNFELIKNGFEYLRTRKIWTNDPFSSLCGKVCCICIFRSSFMSDTGDTRNKSGDSRFIFKYFFIYTSRMKWLNVRYSTGRQLNFFLPFERICPHRTF